MTTNKPILSWLKSEIPNHSLFVNVQKDKLPSLLKPLRGSVLFIPSRYEGFSLSLVEGMSKGLVPVVYPVGVAPEIIRNGENGFLVSSQAEAIEKTKQLLAHKTLREQLAIEASKTAEQFSGIIISRKLMKLYESIALKGKIKC
jgi:glycosyltransferase involved in cell wall biosynthesis